MSNSKKEASHFTLAVFITPHGFGHAARAAAVLLALREMAPETGFHLFTSVPRWFFEESGLSNFAYHLVQTDVGLAQRTPLEEDLPETLRRLAAFLPFDPQLVQSLAAQVRAAGCTLVLCDVAPLGVAVAHAAGLSAVLEENFTWDWIYAGYPAEQEHFAPFIRQLAAWFAQADLHVLTRPACLPNATLPYVAPVSRPLHQPRADIRAALQIHASRPTVLISLGGIQPGPLDLAGTATLPEVLFILPGGAERVEQRSNCLLLPHHHGIYHPDLVNACDAVVGKLGYSTLAECYAAGTAFGFIPRAHFPESPILRDFCLAEMNCLEIQEADFASGCWIEAVPGLLARPADHRTRPNGAYEIARLLLERATSV
jgi:UDP:flavonoid glycosyltransferase YjiC (YdhE family)